MRQVHPEPSFIEDPLQGEGGAAVALANNLDHEAPREAEGTLPVGQEGIDPPMTPQDPAQAKRAESIAGAKFRSGGERGHASFLLVEEPAQSEDHQGARDGDGDPKCGPRSAVVSPLELFFPVVVVPVVTGVQGIGFLFGHHDILPIAA